MSYNRIILVGNLTKDPELSYTASNTAVCKFGIATNRKWRDREGNDKEDTCFIDCTLFGRSAETFKKYMSKGREVMVEGRLQLNQWTTQEGDKRSRHQVFVENFTFVGSGGGGDGQRSGGGESRNESRGPAPVASNAVGGFDGPPAPTDDDIPF